MLNEPRGFQHNDTTQIDEHDEPTEPMRRAEVDAFVPTIPNAVVSPDEEDVPTPKTATHPFPHQYVQPDSSIQGSIQNTPVYPVLPPKLGIPRENSPRGAEGINRSSQQKRGRGIPITVGMCFVAIQMLLLLRFSLKLVNISSDNGWVGTVYGVSNVFVLPFRALFLQLALPVFFTIELYTLLAILAYGIVSRILVRTLKVLLKTR